MPVAATGAMSLAEASIKSMLSRAVAFHDFVGATGTSGEKIAYALTRIHNGTVAEPLNEDHFDEAERNAIYPMALICTTGYQMVHLSTGTINEYTLAGEIMVCLISFDDPLLTSLPVRTNGKRSGRMFASLLDRVRTARR